MASFFCHVEDDTFVADKLGAEDPVLDLVVFFKQYIGTCPVWSAKKRISLKKSGLSAKTGTAGSHFWH